MTLPISHTTKRFSREILGSKCVMISFCTHSDDLPVLKQMGILFTSFFSINWIIFGESIVLVDGSVMTPSMSKIQISCNFFMYG